MKKYCWKLSWILLGIFALVLLVPSIVVAEENDSQSFQLEVNILNNDTEYAEIVDVEVTDLQGVNEINVEIPNSDEEGKNVEAVANVTATEELVAVEANVIAQSNSTTTSEQEVIDIASDEVDVEALNQKESSSFTAVSSEQAVVDVRIEELIQTDDVDVEVLKEEESSTAASKSSEEAVVDIGIEDIILTDDVDVEVLKEEESSTAASKSSEEVLVDIGIEDKILTDDVDVEVLKEEESSTTTVKSTKEAGVHLGIIDLPLLDTLHVGVLEDHQFSQTNREIYSNSKLLTVGLNDGSPSASDKTILDDLELNVLEDSNKENDSIKMDKSSVVGIELVNRQLGDLAAFVILDESVQNEKVTSNDRGVIEIASNELPLANGIHLGVLDQHDTSNDGSNSFSEGVLQLDVLSDVLDEISVDVLTSEGQTTSNDGTIQKDNAASLRFNNRLLDNAVSILPRVSSASAPSVNNPTNPSDNLVEDPETIIGDVPGINDEDGSVSEAENEGTNNENSKGTNGDSSEETTKGTTEESSEDLNENLGSDSDGSTDENENLYGSGVGSEEEENNQSVAVGSGSDFNGGNGNSALSDSNYFSGSSLPKTGGFFTGIMLLVIAISLFGGGLTIRKFA
ncbi:hypothetical protein WAX74_05145 [Psychrobacillus sp. FJAT-51614]|uniref:Gram-positive cocci surface proteins LPxTG domain-containing protein n=1 Tax=Psychrobacillus mangrovi TaxID=3117745 RepID=A0ABU8F460_9BACI